MSSNPTYVAIHFENAREIEKLQTEFITSFILFIKEKMTPLYTNSDINSDITYGVNLPFLNDCKSNFIVAHFAINETTENIDKPTFIDYYALQEFTIIWKNKFQSPRTWFNIERKYV